MLSEFEEKHSDDCCDHDHDHEHETETDINEQLAQVRSEFMRQLAEDEKILKLVTDLANGKDKWKKLIEDRTSVLEDIIDFNDESMDPLLEIYGQYLEENSDSMILQFNILESRRLLMRDFFIIKTLLAKIGADVNGIDKRLGKIEKSIKEIQEGT